MKPLRLPIVNVSQQPKRSNRKQSSLIKRSNEFFTHSSMKKKMNTKRAMRMTLYLMLISSVLKSERNKNGNFVKQLESIEKTSNKFRVKPKQSELL